MWTCNKCGKEVVSKATALCYVDYSLDEHGDMDEINDYNVHNIYDSSIKCGCETRHDSDALEETATWID